MKTQTENNSWEDDYTRWIEQGTSTSTRRAYKRDVDYFFSWVKEHHNKEADYPVSVEQVLQFCLYHIDINSTYPLKLSTIRRYLASLSIAHKELGFNTPTINPKVKMLLRRAKAAKHEQPNKKDAITLELLNALIDTCDDSLTGLRDKAVLLVGFAAGGRRRSELVNLQVEDLKLIEDGYSLTVTKSKTDQVGAGHTVPVYGKAATALKTCLVKSGVRSGPLFRGIKPNNALNEAISPRTINLIVKRRIKMIGLNPDHFGAHSLRSGFLTETSNQGINITQAMMLSGHKSIKVASGYCRDNNLQHNKATRLI